MIFNLFSIQHSRTSQQGRSQPRRSGGAPALGTGGEGAREWVWKGSPLLPLGPGLATHGEKLYIFF